ncbi:Catalase HPII [Solibacillus isronensis B3W22]|uniref:Catalase n=1 Tax=Solibacillus isronensis B3W22 TaxID=1224748 RepID=K1KHT2_9BACL|nr:MULTISPECIES: catalase [Solibacillus]AMO85136.1 catalase HPII [Solibacillus silvestris]EKB43655.1 Catalase HPII [Solibacillus isronensis B3W22]OBW55902.1 catalase HPII [Solibacillus silvestris]
MENNNKKVEQLKQFTAKDEGQPLTTDHGLKLTNDEHSLTIGERGPTIMEDFHFREKMTHFDHERIPERVVHARGSGAHGVFESYGDASDITMAHFLGEKGRQTPVFVRFSTVAGSRGSAETVRDVRGFATKFYTEEGNYDLVGNNIPVFFIQDAIKFPDFVHAVKPEPHNEIPQAQSAHDTFWDFVVSNEETAHMTMWHMSDRAIPKSFRTMEGFGVNTFRFVNANGEAHFVKFHWKPVFGAHSLVWDEAQKIAGKDPDFNRRDLFDNIEAGNYPEYELAVQLIPQEDEFKFDFDILDPTKIWPEELIPLRKLGKMTLNRNTDNFFAETEQIAFHVGHVVPGIDFSNDPLLQGRLFSYTDTQLIRLGGPNFHELPINRPVCPFHNNQRDGYGRMTINKGRVAYGKNSLQNNTPHVVTQNEGGYAHYQEKIEGRKVRARSLSFEDHYSQARQFWLSQTDVEKQHIINAFSFELGKVETIEIRKATVDMFARVDRAMAEQIAQNIGVTPPDESIQQVEDQQPSDAVSILKNQVPYLKTKKVGIIVDTNSNLEELVTPLEKEGVVVELISDKQGRIGQREIDHTLETASPVLYDGLIVAATFEGVVPNRKVQTFADEIFNHYKALGYVSVESMDKDYANAPGVVTGATEFVEALKKGRHFDRTDATG